MSVNIDQSAYNLGYSSYWAGEDTNPYDEGTVFYRSFVMGWHDANKEDMGG